MRIVKKLKEGGYGMGKFLKQVYKEPSAFKFLNEIENNECFTHGLCKAIKKIKIPQQVNGLSSLLVIEESKL